MTYPIVKLRYKDFVINLVNESAYSINSTDNSIEYDFVYQDEEAEIYHSTKHGIRILKKDKVYKSAVVCAVAGATGIHDSSAVIVDDNLLICCANKVFSLSLPELKLNWITEVDDVTCFQIFNTKSGIFVHGELEASRIDLDGNIVWSKGFADILVTEDGKECFTIKEDHIEIEDWNHRKYKLTFDGETL